MPRLERLVAALAEKEREQILDRVIAHYRITPSLLVEFADMVETALASTREAGRKVKAAREDPKDLILAFLGARPKEPVPLETVLGELGGHGISTEEGTRALNELLAEGECYMPRKGSVRRV